MRMWTELLFALIYLLINYVFVINQLHRFFDSRFTLYIAESRKKSFFTLLIYKLKTFCTCSRLWIIDLHFMTYFAQLCEKNAQKYCCFSIFLSDHAL